MTMKLKPIISASFIASQVGISAARETLHALLSTISVADLEKLMELAKKDQEELGYVSSSNWANVMYHLSKKRSKIINARDWGAKHSDDGEAKV